MKRLTVLFLLLIWVGASPLWAAGEAAAPDGELDDPFGDSGQEVRIADPLERINRGLFWFNDKVYMYVAKPVARGWRVVPEPGRIAVSNFFSNLGAPVRFANSLLQLKFRKAGNELGRFFFNSTVGVFGLLDPASENGFRKLDPEDFGQTMGNYGVGHGCYLVLPFLGPSSVRDGIGTVADTFLRPQTYVLNWWENTALKTVDAVNEISLDKDTYEGIRKDEVDPYLFIRNAYVQRREGQVRK
ncbi:MAG: VacJ family lipoprotein [bacterium]|nr:VacJ family lipoprotein [bacterium]